MAAMVFASLSGISKKHSGSPSFIVVLPKLFALRYSGLANSLPTSKLSNIFKPLLACRMYSQLFFLIWISFPLQGDSNKGTRICTQTPIPNIPDAIAAFGCVLSGKTLPEKGLGMCAIGFAIWDIGRYWIGGESSIKVINTHLS